MRRINKKNLICVFLVIPALVMAFLVISSCHKEPDHVTVQHILIAFKGSIPKETVTRTQEEAEELALAIFQRARGGEDFDRLVKEYSDDQYPGVYKMSNFTVEPEMDQGESSRSAMVKAFGDVSFALDVGEIGLAEYSPEESKYGWHIIKRIG
jgi:parvulin-like peptidyl-prolyl isomerase